MLQHKRDLMSSYMYLEPLSDSILRLNKNIQSVAVISNRGRAIEKISRSEFTEKYPDHLSEVFCMNCVLQVSMGRDFDENYGPINYHVSERRSLTMITFPLDENLILVTTNKNISPLSMARKIVNLINEHRERF
jgi:hypothetical protein